MTIVRITAPKSSAPELKFAIGHELDQPDGTFPEGSREKVPKSDMLSRVQSIARRDTEVLFVDFPSEQSGSHPEVLQFIAISEWIVNQCPEAKVVRHIPKIQADQIEFE